jgi:hypothetical protein
MFDPANPNGRQLAQELRATLDAGGWTCSGVSQGTDNIAPFAVVVPRKTQATNAFVTWSENHGMTVDYRVLPRLIETRIIIGKPKS